MAEGILPLRPRTTHDTYDKNVRRFARSPSTGITTGYLTYVSCATGEVALIDRIVIRGLTNDGATNLTVTFEINGVDCPLHLLGVLDARHGDTLILRPNGNLVVGSGSSLKAKASSGTVATCSVYYRKMSLTKALHERLIPTTIPLVASTNSTAAGGTVAGTAKAIVTAVPGYSIEVLGFYLTGHNYNAAADSIALAFWDGTGTMYTPPATKAATAHPIHIGHAQGANIAFTPRVLVDDTQGCIQGPAGYGLYIQATANLAGATPTADYIVMYRLVKAERQLHRTTVALTGAAETQITVARPIPLTTPASGTLQIVRNDGTQTGLLYSSYSGSVFTFTAAQAFNGAGATDDADVNSLVWTDDVQDVNDPRGATSQPLVRQRKFWVNTIAAATTFVDGSELTTPFFGTAPTDGVVKIKGHIAGYVAQRASGVFTGIASPAGVVIGAGAATAIALVGNVGLDDANPNGADSDTSRAVQDTDELVTCNISQLPSYLAYQGTAGDIVARSQTTWGTFASFRDTTGFAGLPT